MDLFEYMQQKLGCSYISDLHYHQCEVHKLFQEIEHFRYSKRELDDFCQYIFNQSYDDFLKYQKENDERKLRR